MAQPTARRQLCRRTRAQLSGYLDRELDARTRGQIALHLASCVACRREEAVLPAVVAALHRLPSCRGAAD
jgi:anti-sigma factor RsiW